MRSPGSPSPLAYDTNRSPERRNRSVLGGADPQRAFAIDTERRHRDLWEALTRTRGESAVGPAHEAAIAADPQLTGRIPPQRVESPLGERRRAP